MNAAVETLMESFYVPPSFAEPRAPPPSPRVEEEGVVLIAAVGLGVSECISHIA